MCPMILNRLSDGPATVLSPSQEHAFAQFPSQSSIDSPGTFNGYPASSNVVFGSNSSAQPSPSSFDASSTPVPPRPSRKRSRDEAHCEEVVAPSTLPAPQAPKPKVEPIYGEGMILLNPQTGLALSAESQTGTWYEQESELRQAAAAPVASRSNALRSDIGEVSRKSQRLDQSAPGLDDIALSSIRQRLNGSGASDQHRGLNTGPAPPAEPLIDDATRLLGIGWQRINADDDMAPAIRGWAKYIDNQYSAHLRDSQILIKSRALNAYLVAATPHSGVSPAFYLFTEDLTQGQLVASSWEQCLQNLRSSPIVFEGAVPLAATDRPDAQPASFNTTDTSVPLLQQALASNPQTSSFDGLSGGVETGMEIDS